MEGASEIVGYGTCYTRRRLRGLGPTPPAIVRSTEDHNALEKTTEIANAK